MKMVASATRNVMSLYSYLEPYVFIKIKAATRGDYQVAEMIGQKSSIAIYLLNLVGHPYIALER